MKGWKHIYTSADELKFELLQAMLHDHDIETSVIDKKDNALVMLGSMELYVHDVDAVRALRLIEESELTYEEE